MFKILSLVFTVIVSGIVQKAWSASDPCLGVGSGDRLECAVLKLKEAERELNLKFSTALKRTIVEVKDHTPMMSEAEKDLEQSQHEWLKWREAHCRFEGSRTFAAANFPAFHETQCKVDLTKERVQYLDAIFPEK